MTPLNASTSDARGHRARLATHRSLVPRPPGRASRRGGRRGLVRSFCGRWAVERKYRSSRKRHDFASVVLGQRTSFVSFGRARWPMRLVFGALGAFGAAATVVAGTAVGYGTMLGSTPAPCSCGSPERRESSASATAPKSPLVREATRREAYDRLAESFDEEIEWHELVSGIKLMRWWMLRQLKGDVLEVAAGCVPRASDHTETKNRSHACKKSRTSSIFRVALRPSSPRSRPLVRASDLSPPPNAFVSESGPAATWRTTPPACGSPRRIAPRRWWRCAERKPRGPSTSRPRLRHQKEKKNTERRMAGRARRRREKSRTAVRVWRAVRP